MRDVGERDTDRSARAERDPVLRLGRVRNVSFIIGLVESDSRSAIRFYLKGTIICSNWVYQVDLRSLESH